MSRQKISVPTRVFQKQLKVAMEQAMSLGAQGVQFELRNEVSPRDYGATARRELLHYLSERNLQTASGYFPLRNPLAAPEHLDERLAALASAIEFAGQLKIRQLVVPLGPLPAEDDSAGRSMLRTVLNDLAAQGNHAGVVLCLTSGESVTALRTILEQVKSGPVAVNADLAGWILAGHRPEDHLRGLHEFIGHVVIRDAVRGYDGAGHEVPVGRGEMRWDEIVALLEEMNYQGWLLVNRTEGSDRVGDISRAIQYLGRLFPAEA